MHFSPAVDPGVVPVCTVCYNGHNAMDIQTKHFMLQDNLWASCYVCRYLLSEEEAGEAIYWFYCQHTQIPAQTE